MSGPTSLFVPDVPTNIGRLTTYSARLTQAWDGAPIPGQNVSVDVGWIGSGSAVTSPDGWAYVYLPVLTWHENDCEPITALFAGAGDYLPSTGPGWT